MEIIKLDMEKYLGRGIRVYMKGGYSINFKPTEMKGPDKWIGYDDEGNLITVRRRKIECVILGKGIRAI
jgi:hypothetical protein